MGMKNQELKPTLRDYKVLAALEKWGVLGLGQLYGIAVETDADAPTRVARFFNDTERRDYGRWFAQRLTALAKDGLIQDPSIPTHPKIYTLTERGHKELKARSLATLPGFRGSISGELVNHELSVAAAGLVLSELFHYKVRTDRERYIWTGRGGRRPAPVRTVSDLWIVDAQPKAIEVELTQKSEGRYKEIWDAYRLRLPDKASVLYLTTWPSGVSCILDHAREFRAEFVYACDMDEFRSSCGSAPFQGIREGDVINLKAGSVPNAGEAPRRVSSPSLPARQDVSAGGRLGDEPFAPPPRPGWAAALIPPASRRDQSVSPPESRACPRPLPLSSPSPSPEGDRGGAS